MSSKTVGLEELVSSPFIPTISSTVKDGISLKPTKRANDFETPHQRHKRRANESSVPSINLTPKFRSIATTSATPNSKLFGSFHENDEDDVFTDKANSYSTSITKNIVRKQELTTPDSKRTEPIATNPRGTHKRMSGIIQFNNNNDDSPNSISISNSPSIQHDHATAVHPSPPIHHHDPPSNDVEYINTINKLNSKLQQQQEETKSLKLQLQSINEKNESHLNEQLLKLSKDLYDQYNSKHESKINLLQKNLQLKFQSKLNDLKNLNDNLNNELKNLKKQLQDERNEKNELVQTWDQFLEMERKNKQL